MRFYRAVFSIWGKGLWKLPDMVNVYITNWKDHERSTIFNGWIHYFDWVIFNSYVKLPEGNYIMTHSVCSSQDFCSSQSMTLFPGGKASAGTWASCWTSETRWDEIGKPGFLGFNTWICWRWWGYLTQGKSARWGSFWDISSFVWVHSSNPSVRQWLEKPQTQYPLVN
jgi:hypothetical protein